MSPEQFLNGVTHANHEKSSKPKPGGLSNGEGDFKIARSHNVSSIYPDMNPLTRDDFESEEDWITYSTNQWFGHLFIDPHLD